MADFLVTGPEIAPQKVYNRTGRYSNSLAQPTRLSEVHVYDVYIWHRRFGHRPITCLHLSINRMSADDRFVSLEMNSRHLARGARKCYAVSLRVIACRDMGPYMGV